MGVTPTYQLPYPDLGELPDGPSAVRNLATKTEEALRDAYQPAVRMIRRNTPVSIPNATNVALGAGWVHMTGDMGDACGILHSGGVFTVTERGLYRVTMSFYFTGGNDSAHRIIGNIQRNAAYTFTVANNRTGNGGCTVVVTAPALLEPGDTINGVVWQASGATAQISGDRWTWYAIELVHRIPA